MSGKLSPLNIIKQTNNTHSGTVLFFHGSGDTGRGIRDWVKFLLGKDLSFPHLQVVYPTAPQRPYTPLDGGLSNVWFDRLDINPEVPDHKETLDAMCNDVTEYINKEVANGIPLNRIIVGGFSMGGALALNLAYIFLPSIAGTFCLSSFLGNNSLVYNELKSVPNDDKRKQIPLFMCHGDNDDLVPIQWGENVRKNLTQYGIPVEFHPIRNTMHELEEGEIRKLSDWILRILPPLDSDRQ